MDQINVKGIIHTFMFREKGDEDLSPSIKIDRYRQWKIVMKPGTHSAINTLLYLANVISYMLMSLGVIDGEII